ncbi:uncharacterized protein LOC132197893 [Neocloeon triangulifer]|uniref:uncharacterized protein LOC132197893 n=1 Tax=Neocloeon triangulifer TaxID=2078957 RepID=UPI00286F23CE|nr:uncharacterized protein LOC132197893 [Neocloeon triangulifer]XP_059477474.1 uncharacterized protein LOC132197893 [Neocloeon triangulifer]
MPNMDNDVHKQDYPNKEPAKLGYFETAEGAQENADNVFVLVVHFDFKEGEDDWHRRGDEKDVENLRVAFETNRKCGFREKLSPTKKELLDLLQDEQEIKRLFESDDLEPDLFFLIILSHGAENGIIFTDRSSQTNKYETFTTKEVFDSIGSLFPKCLKFALIGACRGKLEEKMFHLMKPKDVKAFEENKNSSRISFEPKTRNLIIIYAAVETTTAKRHKDLGTWMVECMCAQLNKMKRNEGILQFLTGTQNRVHQNTINSFMSIGQTPEFKVFSCDRRFVFHLLDTDEAASGSSKRGTDSKGRMPRREEKPQSVHFTWWNPNSKTVLRERRAVIFHQGAQITEPVAKLNFALINNLGFETILAKLDAAGLEHYFSKRENDPWLEYGCFAAFIFADVVDVDGQMCIRLSQDENKPIGDLIYGLLGPKNDAWIGKPKLLFLLDQKLTPKDTGVGPTEATQTKNNFLAATNFSGWFVFVLQNTNFIQQFIAIFESEEIKDEQSSLQELLEDLLTKSSNNPGSKEPDVMVVSTLPNLLSFPALDRQVLEPCFDVEGRSVDFDEFLNLASTNEARVWLLTSPMGSGKSTMFREIAFQLQRRLDTSFKVFLVVLADAFGLFARAKKSREAVSLVNVVSHVTGNRNDDIKTLIEANKAILMFDGFDRVQEYETQAHQVLAEATGKNLPVWISTRPRVEDAVLAKLNRQIQVRKAKIVPLNEYQQVKFFMLMSGTNAENEPERARLNSPRLSAEVSR